MAQHSRSGALPQRQGLAAPSSGAQNAADSRQNGAGPAAEPRGSPSYSPGVHDAGAIPARHVQLLSACSQKRR